MARVLLLRQFESKKGISYKADFCDISQWLRYHFVKPTGLSLNKNLSEFYFERYCKYFSREFECTSIPRSLMLAFMYCHACHECNVSLNKVQHVVIEFNGENVDVYCMLKRS